MNAYRRVYRRMSLTTCAVLLLFLIIVNAICCPCFISTRKGLLLIHWILANFLASKDSARWREIPFDSALGVLLPFATVLLVVENGLMDAPRSCGGMSCLFFCWSIVFFIFFGMLPRKRILTALLLLFMDVVFVVVNIIAEFIVDVLLALALLIGIAFRFAQRKKPHLRKEKDLILEYPGLQELLSLYHDDLFCDPFDIFSGSGGCLNYCAITASVLIKVIF
uniref:Inner membrane protein n=1 Tax=Ascaris lumbricoides TaxID=6252 RepID=A0A0M3IB64_ASCLU